MPREIFRLNGSKDPPCWAVDGGYTRRDLRRFLRNEVIENTQQNSPILSLPQSNIVNFPVQKPNGIAVQKLNDDMCFQRVKTKAKKFRWIDSNTGLPVRKKWEYGVIKRDQILAKAPSIEDKLDFFFQNPYDKNLLFRTDIVDSVMNIISDNTLREKLLKLLEKAHYATYVDRLSYFWYLDSLRIATQDPLALRIREVDRYTNGKKYSRFVEVETLANDEAVEVRSGRPKLNGIIWEGYLHNFWPIFQFNPKTDYGQIDDSLDPIGIYVNPWGSLTIEYEKDAPLHKIRKRNAAIVAFICYGIPYLEDLFGQK